MGSSAGTAAEMAGIHASVAALEALFLRDAAQLRNPDDAGAGVDVLQGAYELRLERMLLASKLEGQVAALKARDAAEAVELQQAMTPPDAPVRELTFQEISTIEEIAGVLTISSGAAGAFVTQARRVCSLPSVYGALSTGALSWQQARIIADEAENLDHTGAVALADHFLDPDAANPARGCPATDLVPSRLRAKVHAWRERHHPESIEKRHAKSVADRRVEFTRDRDGMAWFSAYLSADSAAAIWNKTTAIARGLQGPNETRTLTQIKADVFVSRALAHQKTSTGAQKASTGAQATNIGAQATNTGPLRPVGLVASTAGPASTRGGSWEPGMGDGYDGPDGVLGLASILGSDEPAPDTGLVTSGVAETPAGTDATAAHPQRAGADVSDPGVKNEDLSSPDAGKVPTPRADVIVTVPVFALLGLTGEAAVLDGYGPIPASMARKLLAEGADSFTRVLVDPRDGAPLEIGRRNYRLTKAMRHALNLRDGKCTFPGCNNSSLDNDADHLTAWQHGGATGISNLAQLCPKHHRLKHSTGWTPTPATNTEPPGWISPTGRHYTSEQPDREPPQWPPAIYPATAAADDMHGTDGELVCPPWLEWGDIGVTDADVPDDIFDGAGFEDGSGLLEDDPANDQFPDWLLWLEAEEAALSHQ